MPATTSRMPPADALDIDTISTAQRRRSAKRRVHAEQIGREQRRLLAAGAGPDLEQDVLVVVRILGHEQLFERLLEPLLLGPRARSPPGAPARASRDPSASRAPRRSACSTSRCWRSTSISSRRSECSLLSFCICWRFASTAGSDEHARTAPRSGPRRRPACRAAVGRARRPRALTASSFGRRRVGALAVLLLEALDAAGGVDELLLARVERVAGRADVDHERRAGRVGLDLVPAGAGDGRGLVDRMNSLFRHGLFSETGLYSGRTARMQVPPRAARPGGIYSRATMSEEALSRRLPLYAYLEPLLAGRRVLEIGKAREGSAEYPGVAGRARVVSAEGDASASQGSVRRRAGSRGGRAGAPARVRWRPGRSCSPTRGGSSSRSAIPSGPAAARAGSGTTSCTTRSRRSSRACRCSA